MPRRQFHRKSQRAAQISWYLGAFSTNWAHFLGLFRCPSEPPCQGDDFLENHSMRHHFYDTWRDFRPSPRVFVDYFGVRWDPHAQETISSQIITCSANLMVPAGFSDLLSTFLRTISVSIRTLMPRRWFPRKSLHAAPISWYLGRFSTSSARFSGLFWCPS